MNHEPTPQEELPLAEVDGLRSEILDLRAQRDAALAALQAKKEEAAMRQRAWRDRRRDRARAELEELKARAHAAEEALRRLREQQPGEPI